MSLLPTEPYLDDFMGQFYLYKEGLYYNLIPIPKNPDMDYCRRVVWQIHDLLDTSQYISRLSWDKPTDIMPGIDYSKAPNELYLLIGKIQKELTVILAKKWNKDWI